ncbi:MULTISPECIES: HD-GYP domain-containing protein [Clostridium]|uniref:Cyclic di-GMP phosphodiesterase response regulator RpfG n=1 Tax=Clostridium saccharoperbutylacetonicum N1-4(HMT) TaxID=931276 RepID=M1MST0_9CLOT|nr:MULTISPECIES: HD-GYP domain-containing protein [Clostridium]AGF54632.1 cyclic di-GMP phosphodiesterase response regulator RpfG [Clostridium saccharoperbutylacetonicum N1-4(HMT)]AQR93587.1 cyclic di-GMP phosphodiesterase response regulator RpfG [Clostridium saccharoperbutylacetonicum]NRT58847.1 putative nucleotidyltransferase with HDIG domain [Clostridium saccharoperbutylacetonicum]NSB28036.1 putative nucleotidyltransferase with HDIG domain [Clostridium saccharoperbutylacetonicum]NSB29286.1 
MLEEYNDYMNHDILNTMVATLEAKDLYTYNHSTRVAEMAYVLGELLGMSKVELELMYIAGDLHDIGKIGIPDIILNKPERLESDEWRMMKRHSNIGYSILSKARYFEEVSKIVLHHHERWDGKGYPDGLKENQIPLESRILAVCDSVDAMKSDRPYRKSISDEICKDEIRKNKGIMYDSDIAECMLKNWDVVVMKCYN